MSCRASARPNDDSCWATRDLAAPLTAPKDATSITDMMMTANITSMRVRPRRGERGRRGEGEKGRQGDKETRRQGDRRLRQLSLYPVLSSCLLCRAVAIRVS